MSAVWWFLWGQLCLGLGLFEYLRMLLAKTHAQAQNTRSRVANLPAVAKTANTLAPLSTHVTALSSLAGNTLLPTLAQQFSPGGFGGPASNSNANLFNWANDATARFNQIYTTMQATNLWT